MVTLGLAAQAPTDLFEKAPPHVDEALRGRIKIFYQAHVDGKFRVADSVVHEDSKDAFFTAQKDQHKGFEIVRINYTDNFTKASVVTAVETDFLMPGFGKRLVQIPLTTLWKLDKGEWWWYVLPKEAGVQTPFGTMKPGDESSDVAAQMSRMPGLDAIRNQVAVSKTEVKLSSVEPGSDEVVISNGMPGRITLNLQAGAVTGLEINLDRRELGPGEKAVISIRFTPSDRTAKPPVKATLTVHPTNHVIPIQLTFAVPPELEKKLKNQ